MFYLRYLCLFTFSGLQHMLCCVLVISVLCTKYPICRCFVCLHSVVTVISQRESHGTVRFVVYRTCAKYRIIEYYRACRFINVIVFWLFLSCVPYVASFFGLPSSVFSNVYL
jgi:hypothetical protein